MSTLLAIDPGIRGCGCALFVDGRLFDAQYVRNPVPHGNDAGAIASMAYAVGREYTAVYDSLICEWPQIYTLGQRGSDPNDLLPLAGIDGALFQLFGEERSANVRYVLPRVWKGQVDPNTMARRILSRLEPGERERIVADLAAFEARVNKTTSVKASSDITHNIVDAVGIGLWALDRLQRQRVIHMEGSAA